MRTTLILAAALALALGGCSLPAADKEADAAARALYAEVRSGADLTKDAHLDASLKDPSTLAQLSDVSRLIPPAAPTKVDNRSWRFNTDLQSGTRAELIHAYRYPDRTVLAETVLQKAPGQKTWKIIGFHVRVEGAEEKKQEPAVSGEGPEVRT
jgi:hypothetical protein